MSGGHFDYKQYAIQEMADDLLHDLEHDSDYNFDDEVLDKILETCETMKTCAKMMQRVDWFLSSDDNQDDLLRRWKEDGLK